ncbi:uncharacterized protein LOC144925452, partial [Branchiostoma floridae x Branchiostoma belcheri]
ITLLSAELPAKKEEEIPSREGVFKESIRSYYELKLPKFKPLIWNDNFILSLSDVFTELKLIQTREKRSDTDSEIKGLDDLFKMSVEGQSKAPRCILIEAEPGGGKTTFMSKEAMDAVSQKTELGRRHDIVLLFRLREVWEGETIEEMVCDQCVPETTKGVDVQAIYTILQNNESRVLFLLDGYDELRPEARVAGQAIPKLLSGKMYPKSTIVITSRPSAEVQQYTRPDCHAHIIGFSYKRVIKFVGQYFTAVDKQDLVKTLTAHLFDTDLLDGLVETPIFLMLVCLLWEEDQAIVSTGSMTGLYDNLLLCLVRKLCKREGVDMPSDGIPKDLTDALLQLGKLALEALLRYETQLDRAEAERQNLNCELLLKLGVVFAEESASKLHPRKQLTFAHKTIQEYLAGRYVASVLGSRELVDLLKLTSIKEAFEYSTLLQFTCGCDSRAATAVMDWLAHLIDTSMAKLSKRTTKFDQPRKEADVVHQRLVLLCLRILYARREPEMVQAVSQVLPYMVLQNYAMDKRQHAALKYYLKNFHPSNPPYKMILEVNGFIDNDHGLDDVLQYLEETFTCPTPGLQLDLTLCVPYFYLPEHTANLVSALRNIPELRSLVLLEADLTLETLQPLVRGFRHMSRLEKLSLIYNPKLGDAEMELLQGGLEVLKHLAVLIICDCNVTDVMIASLTPRLGKLSGLKALDLSLNKINDTGLESLTTVFPNFMAMQVLALRQIGISPAGMRTFAPALRYLAGLLRLDISWNEIGDIGIECLANVLHCLAALNVLQLSKTGISDMGISALVKALPHLVRLKELDVRYNMIGESGVVSLVQTHYQRRSLDVDQNPDESLTTAPQCDDTPQEQESQEIGGATGVRQGVSQPRIAMPKLTKLDISRKYQPPVHLSDTAARAVAEALPRLPSLECLGLAEFSMEAAGFQALVQAAEEHPKMRKLTYTKELVPGDVDTSARCLRASVPFPRFDWPSAFGVHIHHATHDDQNLQLCFFC